jgi:alpha-1,2-mannosyltransferase
MAHDDAVLGTEQHAGASRVPAWAGPVIALAVALVAAAAYLARAARDPMAGLDLEVYRLGARALLDGLDVYALELGPNTLPFTYPPAALVLLSPLGLLGPDAASWAMLAASVVALVLVCRWCLEHARGRAVPWWAAVLAASAALLLWPVRSTLLLGQVNLLLLAVVVGLDLRGRRWPGAGAGIAAAVKVTPALLVVAQALRGDLRAAWRGAASWAALTLLGLALLPQETWRYFTDLLWQADRPGSLDAYANQSLRGAVERHLEGGAATAAVVTLTAAALACAAWAVRRHRHDAWTALSVAMIASLLVSPVSWVHHWVWALPALAVGARRGLRTPVGAASALLGLAFVATLVVWRPAAILPGTLDMFVAVGVLWLLAAAATRPAPASPPTSPASG